MLPTFLTVVRSDLVKKNGDSTGRTGWWVRVQPWRETRWQFVEWQFVDGYGSRKERRR